jgi:GNAT superfamily N-acetyltransferase
MAGWHLSQQARSALVSARELARGRKALGSADPLLAAVLGQWDEEGAGGPALLRACGLTGEQAAGIAADLLPPVAADDEREPRVIGGLRFVVDQAYRIAAEAHAAYVGTEHLVVAILWQDCQAAAHHLRRHGVTYALAAERLAGLPATERGGGIDPLEAVEVPTPSAARLDELARQQAEQHPVEGDGRLSTLHHLLAVLMDPRSGGRRALVELGVDYEDVTRRIADDGSRLVAGEDWRPEEQPLEGWERFDVTPEQNAVIGRRVMPVLHGPLWDQGVRFGGSDTWVMLHPGHSGLGAREILERILDEPEPLPALEVEVEAVERASDELVEACRRLLPQLSSSAAPPTAADLDRIAGHEAVTLLVARGPDGIVGMLTLVVFPLPSGLRARIEDVVVDEAARGRGVGTALTLAALERARARGARNLDLTSRVARVAANRLYRELGFRRRPSNVYRYQLDPAEEG